MTFNVLHFKSSLIIYNTSNEKGVCVNIFYGPIELKIRKICEQLYIYDIEVKYVDYLLV